MFAEVVRANRQRLGLTQEELATRAGLGVRTVRKLEAGQVDTPRPATVRLLADAFGLAGAGRERFCQAAGELTGPGAGGRAPAQLPADVPAFTGRAEQLAHLDALLLGVNEKLNAVMISALSGTAGVGKTALAVHWAHRVADRFPDGQLYVNLRGFHPKGEPLDPAAAVVGFLEALQVPPRRIPHSPDAQIGLYRSLLADRRVLVLLDNARNADQVRPLLPGAAGCLALVTSRHQLSGLVAIEGAVPVALDLLPEHEARQLLTSRLGSGRITAEPVAVAQLLDACAGLPLALAVVAARAATRPHLPLAAVAAEVGHAAASLEPWEGVDAATNLRAVFSWSYHALEPAAARLFRLLGLHPGPDFTAGAAASLTGVPPAIARRLLGELADAHLLAEPSPSRYTLHDLLRTYATELTYTTDSDVDRRAAHHRLLDYYLHTAHTATTQLNPHQIPVTPAPSRPGTSPEQIAGLDQALAWFTRERAVLVAAIHQAATAGYDIHAWQLAWATTDYLDHQGHWQELADTCRAALAAAQRLADPLALGLIHGDSARRHVSQGAYHDAHAHLRQSLHHFETLGHLNGQARTHFRIGYVLDLQGHQREGLDHAQRALELYRVDGDVAGQANTLNSIGWAQARLGDFPQALRTCRQALAIQQRIGDQFAQASTWHSLGFAHHHLKEHEQAIRCYQTALGLTRETEDRYHEATVFDHLGDTRDATGDYAAARRDWRRALTILDQLDHPDAAHLRAKICHTPLNDRATKV